MADDKHASGMLVRRAVLGDAHVDRTKANKTAFDEDYQRLITESAWGSVWTREGLTRRERSLLVIAFMAALGHHDELAMHIRATANTGASPQDVKEVLLMTAIYAGVPAANAAIVVAKRTFSEMGVDLGEPEHDE
ncbi:MAG: 4-carboxymuconolactone decarboxylase [Alphaproteobacteria bacterium]